MFIVNVLVQIIFSRQYTCQACQVEHNFIKLNETSYLVSSSDLVEAGGSLGSEPERPSDESSSLTVSAGADFGFSSGGAVVFMFLLLCHSHRMINYPIDCN